MRVHKLLSHRRWDAPVFFVGFLLLLAGVAFVRRHDDGPVARSRPGVEVASASVAAVRRTGGPGQFHVPIPGDPDYADYREMLAEPRLRSSVENSPGYAMPYDPEWRSVVEGRRRVGPTSLEFTEGETSLRNLGDALLKAVREHDLNLLNSVRVDRDEYQLILWPEFPQSRPFLRIPPDEAWMFQSARQRKGLEEVLARYGDRDLSMESLQVGSKEPFTNFTLYRGVTLTATDVKNGKTVQVLKDATVAERNGRFKLLSLRG